MTDREKVARAGNPTGEMFLRAMQQIAELEAQVAALSAMQGDGWRGEVDAVLLAAAFELRAAAPFIGGSGQNNMLAVADQCIALTLPELPAPPSASGDDARRDCGLRHSRDVVPCASRQAAQTRDSHTREDASPQEARSMNLPIPPRGERSPYSKRQWWNAKKHRPGYFATCNTTLSPTAIDLDLVGQHVSIGFSHGVRIYSFPTSQGRDRFVNKYRAHGAKQCGDLYA